MAGREMGIPPALQICDPCSRPALAGWQASGTGASGILLDRSGSMSGLGRDTIGGAIHHIGNKRSLLFLTEKVAVSYLVSMMAAER